ncbi:response regulator transcription factor [Eubacteriales bacterium OttesenSCG-928-A19]|nr:response regulator transcription factor [Eubacteriales bacterium OttesenSCG-928-A19]
MRILVAEDERSLNAVICKTLAAEGYGVDACYDGAEALDYFASANYDAAVLDVMMPGHSGFEVLRMIRAQGNHTPVLFLTARDAVADRVEGLDSGANDYLVKPFAFEELLARLRVLTRAATGVATNEFTVGDLTLDSGTHTVTRGGEPITLSAKEFSVLEYLIRNPGVVLSRERIESHVWDFSYEGGSNVVDVYIRYLRKKIDDGRERKLLHTVRGVGYVLREEV